jgi:hypothetical protein
MIALSNRQASVRVASLPPWFRALRPFYARMLIDRGAPGDREKARELLRKAIVMHGQIGVPNHVEMA